MSKRPAGYDKYYSSVRCADCGGYTGKDYAWRFGHDEPTVFCSDCKHKRNRKRAHAAKHPQNHRKDVYCHQCQNWMRTISSSVDNRPEYDLCATCKSAPPKEVVVALPPPSPPPTNEEIVDRQFLIQ